MTGRHRRTRAGESGRALSGRGCNGARRAAALRAGAAVPAAAEGEELANLGEHPPRPAPRPARGAGGGGAAAAQRGGRLVEADTGLPRAPRGGGGGGGGERRHGATRTGPTECFHGCVCVCVCARARASVRPP